MSESGLTRPTTLFTVEGNTRSVVFLGWARAYIQAHPEVFSEESGFVKPKCVILTDSSMVEQEYGGPSAVAVFDATRHCRFIPIALGGHGRRVTLPQWVMSSYAVGLGSKARGLSDPGVISMLLQLRYYFFGAHYVRAREDGRHPWISSPKQTALSAVLTGRTARADVLCASDSCANTRQAVWLGGGY